MNTARVILKAVERQAPDPDVSDPDLYMTLALDRIRESVAAPSEFQRMGSLSMCAFQIAQELAVATAIEVGAEPLPWPELPEAFRVRMRHVAELAIRLLDPDTRVSAADEAVVDVVEWAAGPFDGSLPSIADVARRAIARYEMFLGEAVTR